MGASEGGRRDESDARTQNSEGKREDNPSNSQGESPLALADTSKEVKPQHDAGNIDPVPRAFHVSQEAAPREALLVVRPALERERLEVKFDPESLTRVRSGSS